MSTGGETIGELRCYTCPCGEIEIIHIPHWVSSAGGRPICDNCGTMMEQEW